MKEITTRETGMLLLLLAIGFGAIMVIFVIIPLHNRLLDERGAYSFLYEERGQIDALLETEPIIRSIHAEAAASHKKLTARFLDESHLSQVGRMLTRLNEAHGLSPIDQRLSAPMEFEGGENFLFVTADMTVNGTYDDLKRLLDTVEQTEYLRISRISFSLGGENKRISLSFEVTMIRGVA